MTSSGLVDIVIAFKLQSRMITGGNLGQNVCRFCHGLIGNNGIGIWDH